MEISYLLTGLLSIAFNKLPWNRHKQQQHGVELHLFQICWLIQWTKGHHYLAENHNIWFWPLCYLAKIVIWMISSQQEQDLIGFLCLPFWKLISRFLQGFYNQLYDISICETFQCFLWLKICIKYRKQWRSSVIITFEFSLFWPQKVHSKAKIELFLTFMLIIFLV